MYHLNLWKQWAGFCPQSSTCCKIKDISLNCVDLVFADSMGWFPVSDSVIKIKSRPGWPVTVDTHAPVMGHGRVRTIIIFLLWCQALRIHMSYHSLGLDLDRNLNFLSESQNSDLSDVVPWQISCKEEIVRCGGTGHKSSRSEGSIQLKQFYI